MHKTDQELGNKVQLALSRHNLENDVNHSKISQWANLDYQQTLITKLSDFIDHLGLHSNSDKAAETAVRMLQYFIEERFTGLNYHNFPKISLAKNDFAYNNPLIAKDIPVKTICEHHLVPINGNALIAYRPRENFIGLNKLNLILNFFANRPQLQERLTKQVYIALCEILETADVAIVINARHECMAINGIKDNITTHSTYELGGIFLDDLALKTQILQFCGKLN